MRILVVIQNQASREMVTQSLASCGHEVVTTGTVDGALELLATVPFPVVISDLELETLDDEPLSARLTRVFPDTQVIITTSHPGSLNEAVGSLRQGGYSFLVKTFEDLGLLSAALNRAIDNVRMVAELRARLEDLQKKNHELAGLNQTLQDIEVRDVLTGLHNQLYFQEALGKELIRSLQNKRPFSFLLLEVHLEDSGCEGESVIEQEKLGQLAQTLKGRLRRSDLVTLYRPQTFGMLLPETTKDAGQYVISNLLELLETFPFTGVKTGQPLAVRALFGMASFPEDGSSLTGLVQEAENSLLQASSEGGQIVLPTHQPKGSVVSPSADQSANAERPRRRVLVVDDEPSICAVISQVLSEEGFEVTCAENAEEALVQFQAKPYPVVITDVVMGGMDGMELLRQVKDLLPETEVIIMTSQTDLNPSIKALRAGAFDYLPKPFDDIDIISLVAERAFDNYSRIVEKHRLIAELERKNKGMAMANKTLQDMVIRDGLTSLYNHSYFKEAVEIEVLRSKRYQRQFSVIFMDLDHFKTYNDTYGHPAGDKLLKTIGRLIGERLRKSDTLARYGGEEFTAILPELAKADAMELAEEIRSEIENFLFPGRETQPGGKVTATIGVSSFPEDGDDAHALINCADQALYRGKRQGRNCVSV